MKKISVIFSLSILAVGCASFRADAALTIADQGKSTFTIVLPGKASQSVIAAAQELQRDIAEATQAKLPIQKDSGKVTGPIISLGSTNQARAAGITATGITDGGFLIMTKSGNLYIIGLDTVAAVNLSRKYYGQMTPQPDIPGPQFTKAGGFSNGTANGVYTFLEDYLNVRWLMPGELGRDVPPKSTFKIADLNRIGAPEFVYRVLSLLEKYTESLPAVASWQNQQKLGFSFRMNHEHNWAETVPAEIYKTHPDWFAMIDGQRVPPTDEYSHKIETTNPELVKYFAEKAIAALKADPHQNTYSLSPSDGRGWSESPESKALYDPSPSKLFDPEAPPGPPSMSPLILKFYRDVSSVVAKEYPQGKLAGYIYSDYLYPPTKGGMALPKNFIPMIAPSFDYGYRLYRDDVRQQFDYVMNGWAKVAPPTWFYYDLPNGIYEPYNSGMLAPPATGILNFIFPRLLKSHIKGAYFYGNTEWSQQALANYIGAKLLWNPKLDANALQHEWLARAYGPQAGDLMEQLYQKLDGWFAEYYKQHDWVAYHAAESLFKDTFAPHYGEMEKLFLQANAQPMTAPQKRRLQLIGDNLIVLQWRLRNAEYLPTGFVSPLQRSGAQIADLLFDGSKARQTEDGAFDLFPVLWYQNLPAQTEVKVSLNQAPEEPAPAETSPAPDAGYILLYAEQAGEIHLKPANVSSGSAFVGYRIFESKYHLLQQGLFYTSGTITFNATAKTLYLLRINTQGLLEENLDYELTVPDATTATGSFHDGTLYLQGKAARFNVYVPKGLNLSSRDTSAGVKLSTQSPTEAARTAALQQHAGSKLLLKLDDDWRFQTDPRKIGLQEGVINPGYDDQAWKTITATQYWQDQGFANYHGTAWYRRSFTTPAPEAGERLLLSFGAVDGDAVVYLNGQKIGNHLPSKLGSGWDQPFDMDVTAKVKAGQNTIAVQVTKDIYASGIYQGVSLLGMAN